jgi:hypothetical protein
MSWVTPRNWSSSEVVTASMMNQHVRDNLQFLYDRLVSVRLVTNTTPVSNSGSGETDLITYSVPGGTLAGDGQSLSVLAWGTITSNSALKTIKFKWGGTVLTPFNATTASIGDWWISAVIVRLGATSQHVIQSGGGNGGASGVGGDFATAAETLSGSVTLKLTGQSTASSYITQGGLIVVHRH